MRAEGQLKPKGNSRGALENSLIRLKAIHCLLFSPRILGNAGSLASPGIRRSRLLGDMHVLRPVNVLEGYAFNIPKSTRQVMSAILSAKCDRECGGGRRL